MERQGANKSLQDGKEEVSPGKMNRHSSNRALMQEKYLDQSPSTNTGSMKRQGSNQMLVVSQEDGPEETKTPRSSTARRESRSSNSSKSPENRSSHCSSDEGEAADRKARRRSGRRRTGRGNCESPTSVQHPDSYGYGSNSRSSTASDGSSGPRPRRRPSFNGALALAMPSAPSLS